MAKQQKAFKDVSRTIYFNSIPVEIKRLGITQAKCAELLGCTRSGLMHRIKADKPQLHWAVYGLANYLGEDENLGERDL